MRKTILFILPLTFSTLHAQPELVSSALPPIGTSIAYEQVFNYWMIDTTQQGAGVIWDFNDLTTYGSTIVSVYLDPLDTPEGTSFPSANYARADDPTNYIYYFERTNTHLDLLGRTSQNNNDWNFVDPQRQLVFPMTLGTTNDDIFTGASTGFYNIAGIGTGTLVLPSGTFTNVVMMRTIHSTYYPIYEWFSTENGALLLSYIESDDFNPGIAQFLTEFSTSMEEHYMVNDLRCVDPVIDVLEITFSSEMNGDLDLSMIDPIGRVIRSEVINSTVGSQRSQLFVGDLSRGCYLLTLQPSDANCPARTIRFVKQ